VTGIPNVLLTRPVAVTRMMGDLDGTRTVWDLDRLLWNIDETDVHPEDVVDVGVALGRPVRLLVPEDGRIDRFDAVFDHCEEER
jgi:hypothetical protein